MFKKVYISNTLIIMEENDKRRKRKFDITLLQYNHNVIKSTIRIDYDLIYQ